METILLYHRCNFTYHHLYMLDSLQKRYNIVHLVYSEVECKILKEFDLNIEPIIFTKRIKEIYEQQKLDEELLKQIDSLFIEQTNGRFNLNASIQGDRSFPHFSYEETLLMAQANYLFWKEILENNNVNYVFHEVVTSLSLHICSVLCLSLEIRYLFQMNLYLPKYIDHHWYAENDNFCNEQIEGRYRYYLTRPEYINYEECEEIITKARTELNVAASYFVKKDEPLWLLKLKAMKERMRFVLKKNPYNRFSNSLDYFGYSCHIRNEIYTNVRNYKKYIQFEQIHPNEKYYYYPIHLEPEATITYLCEQLYSNQINLIKNIAAALPVGTYLYVKDHPHILGYRNYHDYLQLQAVPNIRLLDRNIPGKKVIKDSIGVMTINGTAGFEAVLMEKPVYCFGKTYYSFYSGVRYIHNARDLKDVLYNNPIIINRNDLCAYISALKDNLYPGKLWFFRDPDSYPDRDLHKESKLFVDSFMDYIENSPL